MDFALIGILIRLRYKLLWAGTRTRNGKIAWFFAGYLLLVMVLALLGAGGTGAGMVAIHSGRATMLAGMLFTGIFVQGILASVLLGFGMAVIFTETELRRYPLPALERRVIRHVIGVADPFWILFLILDLGVAFGLYVFGSGSFWFGLIAILLLFVCNYIAARAVGSLVERITARKFGAMIMLGLVMCIGLAPALLQPVFRSHPVLVDGLKSIWWTTAPAAAGVAITHPDAAGLRALGVIVLWTLGLAAALIALERWPNTVAVVQSTKITWEDRPDRLAAFFGPTLAPLVAHWLRFYFRNQRFRVIYPLALPLTAVLLVVFSRQPHSSGPFAIALGLFGVVGFIGTGQFAVNQFGYVGGGFRRFLLLPTDSAAAFRAGSYMFVTLSAALILPAAILWTLFAPIHSNPQMLAMLVGASVSSLFLFHGAALWTSLYGARRGAYKHTLGNDLSLAGNIVVIGGMLTFLFVPQIFGHALQPKIADAYWWTTPALGLAGAAFYFVSLRLTSGLFRSRREYLMALMEGKS